MEMGKSGSFFERDKLNPTQGNTEQLKAPADFGGLWVNTLKNPTRIMF